MMKGWKIVELGSICVAKGGKRLPKGHELIEEKNEHPYIRARDIKNGKINFEQPVFINEETFTKISRYIVNKGDVVITIVGVNIGDTAFVTSEFDGANLTENAVRLISNKDKVDALFLKYALVPDYMKHYFQTVASGAAQDKLGIYKIKKVKINLPPLPTQRKIASILSAYDDLIENNLKRIKLLEEKAQLTYEEWFVRMKFPGHENVAINEETGLPEGWGKKTIEDFAEVKGGKRLPKGHDLISDQTDHPYIRVRDLTSGRISIENLHYIKNDTHKLISRYIIHKSDLYISIAGTVGLVGTVPSILHKANLTENCAKICNIKTASAKEYICYYLNGQRGQYHIGARTGGASQPKLALTRIRTLPITLPGSEVLESFHNVIKPLTIKVENMGLQNQLLKEARDILLPRLMTGMINVDEVEMPEMN